MNAKEREARNSRATVVTVKEHCNECAMLKDDVKEREHKAYYPASYTLKVKCCAPCFEVAKKKAADEAREETYGYC